MHFLRVYAPAEPITIITMIIDNITLLLLLLVALLVFFSPLRLEPRTPPLGESDEEWCGPTAPWPQDWSMPSIAPAKP